MVKLSTNRSGRENRIILYVHIESETRLFPERIPLLKETLIDSLHEGTASLLDTHSLVQRVDMCRFLHSVRLSLHLVRQINQYFP